MTEQDLVASQQDLAAACEKEANDLHDFFVEWMGAKVDRSDKVFERFSATVGDSFTLIGPDGDTSERKALEPELEGTYGARPEFKIWIKNCQCKFVADNLCLITYEEWQDIAGVGTSRLSTALFGRRKGAPNGVEWLHVHETWLPGN